MFSFRGDVQSTTLFQTQSNQDKTSSQSFTRHAGAWQGRRPTKLNLHLPDCHIGLRIPLMKLVVLTQLWKVWNWCSRMLCSQYWRCSRWLGLASEAGITKVSSQEGVRLCPVLGEQHFFKCRRGRQSRQYWNILVFSKISKFKEQSAEQYSNAGKDQG